MTDRDAGEPGDVPDEETLLARWSRRKAEARAERAPSVPVHATATDLKSSEGTAAPGTTSPEKAARDSTARDTTTRDTAARGKETTDAAPHLETHSNEPAPAVALPDLDELDQDSDYSAFLAPGVDAALRRLALRKLFHSPKFNTFDGLDTYRDDFTSFPALGDVVTADMRHQCERLAERVVEETEPSAPHPRPAREPPSAQDAPSAGDASSAGVPLPTRDSPPAENLLPARSTHVPGDPPVVTAAPAFEPTPSAPATRPVPSPQDDDEPRNPA